MFGHRLIVICAYHVISIPFTVGKRPHHCTFVMTEDLQICNMNEEELIASKDTRKNRIYSESAVPTNDCPFCRRLFKLTRIQKQIFGSKILVQISDMLHRCCGDCTKYILYNLTTPLSEANMTSLRNSDIVYPVHAHSALVTEMHGFHFIAIYDIPSAFYVTRHVSDAEKTKSIIYDCLGMWPLLVICLLMALIAGFVCWILETWSNEKQFPRSFHLGLFDGFWWSFVSMTTVGYGDKVPKSLVARLFSVLWILVGITISSIYIAKFSSNIIDSHTEKEPELAGKQVGVLRNMLHDSIMIAQHRGIVRTVDYNDTVIGIVAMIKMLERDEIDGFLVSRPTYYYYTGRIKAFQKYKNHFTSIRDVSLHRTEKFFLQDKLVIGMLVKHDEDFEYFKKYFESNWLQLQGCFLSTLNFKEKSFRYTHPNIVIGLFPPFLYATLTIVALIVLFGVLYEARRRYKKNTSVAATSTQSDIHN